MPVNQQNLTSATDRGVIKVCHKEIAKLFLSKHADDILNEPADHGNRRIFLERYFPDERSPVQSESSPARLPPRELRGTIDPSLFNNTIATYARRGVQPRGHGVNLENNFDSMSSTELSNRLVSPQTTTPANEDSQNCSGRSASEDNLNNQEKEEYELSRVNNISTYHPPKGGTTQCDDPIRVNREESATYAVLSTNAGSNTYKKLAARLPYTLSISLTAAAAVTTAAVSSMSAAAKPGAGQAETPSFQPSNSNSNFSTPGRTTSLGQAVNSNNTESHHTRSGSSSASWADHLELDNSDSINMPTQQHLRRFSASLPTPNTPRTTKGDSAISMQ